MSNRAMSWAIEVRGLPIASKAVLMLLADCHNGSTGQCNPSLDWLSERTGLKSRMLMSHLSKLEDSGLIERETSSHGRGRGKSVLYHLKIGILATKTKTKAKPKQVQDIACAKDYTCNLLPLQVQDIACAYNKEEPEENRKHNVSFEDAWNLYRSCKLKARQTKKLAKAQWPKAVKKADPETILKAIKREVSDRDNPKEFVPNLPDMHRWLRDERWQDVEAVTPEQPKSLEDWKRAASDYCELGVWPVTLGPPPHQPGCKAPVGLLKTIAKRMQEHSWHDAITQNIGEAA